MSIQFKQVRGIDGQVSAAVVQYTDESGAVWTVPLGCGNRLETLMNDWVSQGNTTVPADPIPVVIPQSVSRFQAKAALANAGLLSQVETIMADPSTPAMYKLAWSDAQEFLRTSPTIAALSGLLSLTSAQLDQLFIAAATITA